MVGRDLVATCWTTAGIAPMTDPEVSPVPVFDRLRAAADAGFVGVGFSQGDLAVFREGVGFDAIRSEADRLGLGHIEVELVTDWWFDPAEVPWRPTWDLLIEAARAFRSPVIKAGTAFGEAAVDLAPFVDPLRRLADDAAAIGARVGVEPLPFGRIASLPQGAELISLVDHEAAGLFVDYWHVFRAGTTLDALEFSLTADMVVGVELNDADDEVVGTFFEDTRDRRRFPGEGAFDVPGFIRSMRRLGWQGPWGVEMLSTEYRALDLDAGLVRARDSSLACFDIADMAEAVPSALQ